MEEGEEEKEGQEEDKEEEEEATDEWKSVSPSSQYADVTWLDQTSLLPTS